MVTEYLPIILPSYKPGLMIYLINVAYIVEKFVNFDYIKLWVTNKPKSLNLRTKNSNLA